MKKSEQFLSLFQLYAIQREVSSESLAWECGGQEVSSPMTPELLVTEGGRLLLAALDVTDVQVFIRPRESFAHGLAIREMICFFFNQQTSPKKTFCGPIALGIPDR